ncbi:MAG: nucleotide exchange factor GrpE [Candidatus Omnitrophota bacterium]|nr:MAG: nucleotide exchange factor GrpE [Candidatus Omnitrophota bacterium]
MSEKAQKEEKKDKGRGKKRSVSAKKVSLPVQEYTLLKEKAEKAEEYKDSLLRLRAEFENAHKRLEKEKEEFKEFASLEVISKLLPVLDNFEHALRDLKERDKKVREGVEIIYNQLKTVLKKEGLERVKSKGEKFNPEIHYALMQEESDTYPENAIIEEMQAGYKFKGKLIRPAMVKVSKGK